VSLGIICLFIAAKIEEVDTPKASKLIYCEIYENFKKDDLLSKECTIMKSLHYKLSTYTAVLWLKAYMQLATAEEDQDVEIQQFPSDLFAKALKLLDFCILDIDNLKYSYREIAASIIYHIMGESALEKCYGHLPIMTEQCIYWMSSHVNSLKEPKIM